jgi:iron complex outermembrane receptor protein
MAHLTRSSVAAAVAAALGCSLGASGALAQSNNKNDAVASTSEETAGGGLPEVTVSAERFSATVQTTPVAVTALSTEILTERKVTSVQDVSAQIPGIVITPSTGSSNNARIVLRGAGQEQGGINFDPAVGIYIDGVYQPRINGAFFDFYDIQRLEVLRGPQGTLYGRNTSGGAIKIETRRPSYEWTGSAEAAAGEWQTRDGKAFLSGPIIANKLAFSVSGVTRKRDGFIYGPAYGQRIGDMDRRAERVKLLFTPTDSLDITLSGYAMQDYSHPGVGVPLQVGPGVVDPFATGFGRDLTRTEIFGTMGQALYNSGGSLNAAWSLTPNLTLNSISGYGNLRTHGTGSILWMTAAAQQTGNGDLNLGAGGDGRSRDEFWSQEFNATYSGERLKGVAGLYYFDESGEARQIRGGTPNDQFRDTKAYAAFAQGTWEVGHGVGLTAGYRWTKEDADFTQFYYTLVNFSQSLSDSFKGTTPKLGINWQITPDVLTYATWTKGFKSGGINPVPPNANTGVPGRLGSPVPYGPEKVDSYEIGMKFQTPDRRLRLNVAVFDAEYKGLQLPVFFPGTSTSYTSNASGAKIYGVEIEPTWQIIDSLQIYGNAAYTHGKYTEPFICSGANGTFRECSSNKIKGVIPGKQMLGFTWSPALPVPGQLRLLGQWNHTGHYYNNVANEGPLVQTVPVSLYDASISWTDPNERWRIAVDGKNITNKHYVLAGLQLASPVRPSVTGYINDPRVVLLRATVNF